MDMAAAAGSYFSVCWAQVGNAAFVGQQIVMVLHVACGYGGSCGGCGLVQLFTKPSNQPICNSYHRVISRELMQGLCLFTGSNYAWAVVVLTVSKVCRCIHGVGHLLANACTSFLC